MATGKSFIQNPVSPQARRYRDAMPVPRDNEKGFPLFDIKEFEFDWGDVVLSTENQVVLKRIVDEIKSTELIKSYGLKPIQKILFCGLPGTGKTLTASLLSSLLGYPLILVRFDSIVSSFLGETAANLRKIFNFIEQGRWVVLFDEFDVVGKMRDDPYEHGEVKRVVNNLMQMLDGYQGESLLIAATNHEQLLDKGLWRRFDEIIQFDLPDHERRKLLVKKYLSPTEKDKDVNFTDITLRMENFSAADIARVCQDALKAMALDRRRKLQLADLEHALSEQKRRKKVERIDNGK
jgi:SpoVK/Ycf46/Vps4 family AAA+-type ATPase